MSTSRCPEERVITALEEMRGSVSSSVSRSGQRWQRVLRGRLMMTQGIWGEEAELAVDTSLRGGRGGLAFCKPCPGHLDKQGARSVLEGIPVAPEPCLRCSAVPTGLGHSQPCTDPLLQQQEGLCQAGLVTSMHEIGWTCSSSASPSTPSHAQGCFGDPMVEAEHEGQSQKSSPAPAEPHL